MQAGGPDDSDPPRDPRPALAAPRAFLLIGGDSADGDASWPSIEAVRPVWSLLGAADAVVAGGYEGFTIS